MSQSPSQHPQIHQPYYRGPMCRQSHPRLLCGELNSHTPHQRSAHIHASPRSHTHDPLWSPCTANLTGVRVCRQVRNYYWLYLYGTG